MSDVSWTPMQERAIKTDGKSLIVSAAAGSGKTAVLVERIINKICACESPARIDRLLIVTFTRAAANEMRERINTALEKRIKNEPDNKYLLRQKTLLPLADICTMDQFFNNLVKENFSKLSITPDFRILDESESRLISNEAVEEVLDEYYEKSDECFEKLLDVIGCDKSDDMLADSIKRFARYSEAYPSPEKWLNEIEGVYSKHERPQNTQFGEIILKEIKDCCEYSLLLINKALSYVEGFADLEKIYIVLKNDEEKIKDILLKCENKEWDILKQSLDCLSFERFPTLKDEYKNCPEKINSKKYRDRMKEIMDSVTCIMTASEEEYCDDIVLLKPVVEKFIELVTEYKKRFIEKKKRENCYEFTDIVHFCLELLVKDGKPTQAAKELREKYDEILIDEYQDTNEAQDTIFSSISDNERNFFLVGDVKQSIYRFRLAMPRVFLDRISKWKQEECDFADYISLDSNFRSKPEILYAVNYIFERVMSVDAGDMVYDDTQSLKAGAACYNAENKKCVDMLVLNKSTAPQAYTEVQLIADKIEEIMKSSEVFDKKTGKYRAVKYKDICILLRQKKIGALLVKELKSRNIPSYYEEDDGFFNNTEISVMLSFLSLINNPLQDIPLISVLMSPLFGFTPDEISELRINLRKGELYYAVKNSESEKCKYFINKYNEYRSLSSVLSVCDLLRNIYDDTGYMSVVTALNNGEIRRLNLLLLLEYAASYEEYGKAGLSGFIRYTERMKKNKSDFKPAASVSEYADVVKIMTVHKSKGLEFPIVFLSDCARKRNNRYDSLIIHEKIGMGMSIRDKKTFRKYSTVPFEAAKILSKRSDCSEELRILYVALTRAGERLIITSEFNNVDDVVSEAARDCIDKCLNPVAVNRTQTFAELLLKVFMKHKNSEKLREICMFDGEFEKNSDFELNIEIIKDALKGKAEKIVENEVKPEIDFELLEKIKQKTQYSYAYRELSGCSAKLAASSFNKLENNMEYFASSIPQFAKSQSLNSAQKGTAVHRFLETCDFSNAVADVKREAESLVKNGSLTQEQAQGLDFNMLKRFFHSDLFKRISSSDRVVREQKFSISVPVNFAFPEMENAFSNENILVQGVIDCAFFEDGELVVLDYKTDKVADTNELYKRYHRQLEIYKIAAEQIFECKVKQLLLYSLSLGEEKLINL